MRGGVIKTQKHKHKNINTKIKNTKIKNTKNIIKI